MDHRATGVPGKMAQLNSTRNRSRTAATAAALIIGTTLVAMILTGGRTFQHNTDQLLATNYPVDITADLANVDPANSQRIDEIVTAMSNTTGVENAAPLQPIGTIQDQDETVMAGDPAQLAEISAGLTDADVAALEEPGTVLVSNSYQAETLTVDTADGPVELNAVRSDLPFVTALVSDVTAQELAPGPAGTATVWIKVDQQQMHASEMQDLFAALAANSGVSATDFESPLMMRGIYQQVINTIMLTVVGLLGISVLIAFVGVGNTQALSALERTRENALMRALGLTKRGLRAMLSWEAAIICAVGALLGCALGMFNGWAGSVAIFSTAFEYQPGSLEMAWPWAAIGGIAIAAVLAGLIASVIPAHRAAKLSPVDGLATT